MHAYTAAIFALLCLLTQVEARAGSLFSPFTFDSAGVLPKGIRSVRVLGFTTEIEDKWNGSGGYDALAMKFNKGITYRELVEAQADVSDRAQLKGYLLSKDVSMESEVGVSRGIVNTRLTSTIPVAAYGLTDRLTVALVVPVLYSKINVATGWSANGDFQGVLDGLSAEGKHNKKLSFESRLQNVVQTKMASYGYRPLEDEQRQEIGDVTLGAKYLLYKDDDLAVVLSPRVVAPTGRQSSIEKLIDVAPGDGQWDFGLGSTAEYQALSRVALTGTISGLFQAPSQRAKRIPIRQSENPTPDVDYDTYEKLGDIYSAAVGIKYKPVEVWTVSMAYAAQYKGPDEYRGNAYSADRYEWMAAETEQDLQTAQLGVTFSTIPLFKSGKFVAPLETTVSVASTLGGRNSNKTLLAAWELALFF